jgi:hypothetical protein
MQLYILIIDNRKIDTSSLQKQQGMKPHRPGRTITCYYCGFVLHEKHLQVYKIKSLDSNELHVHFTQVQKGVNDTLMHGHTIKKFKKEFCMKICRGNNKYYNIK